MMHSHPIPTIFDTYNAKWMTPAEVARTFIPPPQFTQIVQRGNSLIVGPRGSGKTTLLKMLTEAAVDEWKGPATRRFRSRIDYTGVLIATDVTWNSQVSAICDQRLDPAISRSLQISALVSHSHKALAEAMEFRAHRRFQAHQRRALQPHAREAMIACELARMWKLSLRVPSFYSLRAALRLRMQSLHEMAREMAELSAGEQRNLARRCSFLRVPLLISCRNAVEQFNDAFGDGSHFWAFLFDELELLPPVIRQELFACLRTVPDRVILKLAISPFDQEIPDIESVSAGQRDHDYGFVPLWFARKRKAYRFCKDLWRQMVTGSHLKDRTPQQVFGRSLLDTESNEWGKGGTAYSNGSKHHEYIRSLSTSDPTFKAYLRRHNIDPGNIAAVRGTHRAATLRKVFPLVVARVEYARTAGHADGAAALSQLRSRKISMIYTGAMSLFDVCEGNPRVFKGLVSRLIDRISEADHRIDPDIQADEITQATNRFRALLRTIVVKGLPPSHFPRGILSLLDPIARRMQSQALVLPFTAEPPATFVIDDSVSDSEARMLGLAMNAGAIIYVPEREGDEEFLSMSRVREKRFRLSYLFAAQYGIVPRLGRRVTLRELRRPGDDQTLFSPEDAP